MKNIEESYDTFLLLFSRINTLKHLRRTYAALKMSKVLKVYSSITKMGSIGVFVVVWLGIMRCLNAMGGRVSLRLGLPSDAVSIQSFYATNLGLSCPYTVDYISAAIVDFPTLVIVAEDTKEFMVGCIMGRFDLLTCMSPTGDVICCADDNFSGHVLSIAVGEHSLRQGIGSNLMSALHSQFKDEHEISMVSLHVRTENSAAISFYGGLNYNCKERLPQFYEDGEDAWLMTLQRELFAVNDIAPV